MFSGILLRRMIEDMVAAKNGSLDKGRKIILYSGHDLNVGAQLLALGITKPHSPNYTSAVILELYRNNDQYFVQVSHITLFTKFNKNIFALDSGLQILIVSYAFRSCIIWEFPLKWKSREFQAALKCAG